MMNSPWLRLLVLVAAALPALADDTRKQALVDEMLSLTNAESMLQSTMDQVRTMMQQQVGKMMDSDGQFKQYAKDIEPLVAEYENQLVDVIRKGLNWKEMKPRMAALYGEVFSEEELASIVAFYKTEAGQSFLKKMPALMTRSMQLGQEQMQNVLPELSRLNREFQEKCLKMAAEKAKQNQK